MPRRPAALAVVLLLAAPLSAEAPADARARPVVRELVREGVKGLEARFVVDVPPDRVLATLWDIDRFPDIFPDIKKMQVLLREERRLEVRFFVDATLKEVSYTLRRTLDPEAGRIAWTSIDGDVKSIAGSWTVRPLHGGAATAVTYTSFVDVGYFVPTSVVRDLAIGKVNDMAERVRRACRAPAARR